MSPFLTEINQALLAYFIRRTIVSRLYLLSKLNIVKWSKCVNAQFGHEKANREVDKHLQGGQVAFISPKQKKSSPYSLMATAGLLGPDLVLP